MPPLAERLARVLGTDAVLVSYGDAGPDLSFVRSSTGSFHVLGSDYADVGVLFQLVKELLAAGRGHKPLTLKVVTRGAVSTSDGEVVRPHAAALHGLTRTIAAEHPLWHVACIDLDPTGDPDDEARSLADEDCRARLVALRAGCRLVRGFEPAVMPRSPFARFCELASTSSSAARAGSATH